MKLFIALATSAALLVSAGAASAQVQTITAKPGTVGSDGRKVKDKDGNICKVMVVTGSRMPKAKVCKTAAQWEKQSAEARRELELQLRRNGTTNKVGGAEGG